MNVTWLLGVFAKTFTPFQIIYQLFFSVFMIEYIFKSNLTLQNQFVRWDLHFIYILWN